MRHLLCAAAAACLVTPAVADTPMPSPREVATRDTLTVGVAGAIVPDYEGSDDYRIIPLAAVRGRYHGIAFTTRGPYLYVDVVPRGAGKVDFELGPVAGLRLIRTGHVEDRIVKLLPERNKAIELGVFAGIGLNGLTNPYDRLAFRLDVLHDVGNAHRSTTFSPNIEFSTPVSRTTFVGVQIGAEIVSDRYAEYYYTVTPADSLRTGGVLAPFNASGGMKDWTAGLLVDQSLTGDLLHGLSVFGAGQYSRLVGDFKRSPIVSQRGSASQWVGALGLAYTW